MIRVPTARVFSHRKRGDGAMGTPTEAEVEVQRRRAENAEKQAILAYGDYQVYKAQAEAEQAKLAELLSKAGEGR